MEKYLLFYVWLLHYNSKKDDDPVVRSLWIHTRTGRHQGEEGLILRIVF